MWSVRALCFKILWRKKRVRGRRLYTPANTGGVHDHDRGHRLTGQYDSVTQSDGRIIVGAGSATQPEGTPDRDRSDVGVS
jgi:hypothetical protein